MSVRSGEAWNDEDLRTLRRMYRDGCHNREIAKALERTEASVSARLSTMKRQRMFGPAEPDES